MSSNYVASVLHTRNDSLGSRRAAGRSKECVSTRKAQPQTSLTERADAATSSSLDALDAGGTAAASFLPRILENMVRYEQRTLQAMWEEGKKVGDRARDGCTLPGLTGICVANPLNVALESRLLPRIQHRLPMNTSCSQLEDHL